MESSRIDINTLSRKLYYSRLRIMNSHPFFGVILHDLKMVFNSGVDTFSTNGETIFFNPYYLKDLSDFEIDVCLLHVLIHISLKHHLRYPSSINDQLLHRACDIIANSNLMFSLDNHMQEIVVQGKTLPHKAPNGEEGYKLAVEDVYSMLKKNMMKSPNKSADGHPSDDDADLVQADSFTATNIPIERKKLFKINSSVSKKLYLKQVAYLDYCPIDKDLAWTIDKDAPSFDVDKFTYDNIINYPNSLVVNTTIKLSKKMKDERLPVPFYSNDYQMLGELVDSRTEVDYKSLYFKLNRESLSYFLEHKNAADSEYQKGLNKYLTLPDNIRTHFQEVEKKLKWSKSGNMLFKIRDYVATTFQYDIKYPRAPNGMDPIVYFAEISKKGQCTHFATYMALMLRYYNIPSRLVGGFLTNTSAGEDVDVFLENAHAWVEVYINGLGWITIDPTPVIATLNASAGQGDKFDSHQEWNNGSSKNKNLKEDELNKKLHEAYKTSKSTSAGVIPQSIESLIKGLSETKIDWRVLINDFVQDDISDYSFSPPDNRFSGSSFLLPSFSDRDEKVKKILFMVDVSGSMSDIQIAECFNEINSSITQFNGKIEGFIGFFDTEVKTIMPFDQDTDVLAIKPYGRGGTNFHSVFEAVKQEMEDDLPVKIIILSDGYAGIPDEEEAMGIPVLWIINNKEVTPEWGKLVRLV